MKAIRSWPANLREEAAQMLDLLAEGLARISVGVERHGDKSTRLTLAVMAIAGKRWVGWESEGGMVT